MAESDPVAIDHGGRRVWLKWHMLRRAPSHPPFSPRNLRDGLALGASMEIDIRLMADHNWLCLHDPLLDRETDGAGPVAAIGAEAARRLRIAGADYPPPLLAELTAALAAAAPGACLQLDLKETAAAITAEAVASFARHVAPVARHCLLSGEDWQAVEKLAAGIPRLKRGLDPCAIAETRSFARPADMQGFLSEVLATAPAADAFYLDHRFVAAGLALGVNPIEGLKTNGALVDVWTLDPTTPDVGRILATVIAAGADQITTNDPQGLAQIWSRAAPAGAA